MRHELAGIIARKGESGNFGNVAKPRFVREEIAEHHGASRNRGRQLLVACLVVVVPGVGKQHVKRDRRGMRGFDGS